MHDSSSGQRRQLRAGEVTVLIPAHNRTDHLRKTLSTIVPLLPPYASILVVDDASRDSAIKELCFLYPDRVKYLRTPSNLGVIGARNYGTDHVWTEFLINIDDDSYFVASDFVARTVAAFAVDPTVAVLAYNIADSEGNPRLPAGLEPFLSRTYTGCGNAWRMDAILRLGTYYEGFWRQGEELEHSMRVYDAGYCVVVMPDMVVWHDESPLNRDARRHISLEAANYLKRIALRVPARHLPYMLVRWLGFVVRHRSRLSLRQIRTELGSSRSLARAIRDRHPIKPATFRRIEAIKRDEASLNSRREPSVA